MNKLHKLIGIGLSLLIFTGCSAESSSTESTSESTSNTADNSSSTLNSEVDSHTVEENETTNETTKETANETGTGYDAPSIDEETKQTYLDVINNARASTQDCGEYGIKSAVPALTWDNALYKAAYEHSEDLAESDTFSHDGSGTESDWTTQVQELESGSTMRDRIENNGYTNWTKIGENIAAGSLRDTAQEVIDAWIESDGHCKNLMNPDYKNVGMGHVEKDESTYIHYWTQNFGAQ